jgi:glycosyltransferase involved in cell wall biosynthesis
MSKTVLVCETQVPFVRGGAEVHVRELVAQLRLHGHEADLVSVPFRWNPKHEILAHAAAWRLLNLSECNNRPVDLVIATRFPTYFVQHPNKVVWLIHQHRAAYELAGTPYSDFRHTEDDVAVRAELIRLDTAMLSECRKRFANAGNTAARATRYNGVSFEPLYHPPRLAARLRGGPAGGYMLAVSRLESVKRLDLAIRAMAHVPADVSLQVAGTGSERAALERLIASLHLESRVRLLGEVTDDEIIALYAGALGVIFPPYDEDFGYVTLEAFLARKPVVTTTDAGGPTEFVEDGVSGWVAPPDPAAIGEAVARLSADRARAARFGEAGYERARQVTWAGVIDKLVG